MIEIKTTDMSSMNNCSSSSDMNLDFFNDSLDFDAIISDDEDAGLIDVFSSSLERRRSITLGVLQESIQVCERLEDDFGCSWSSIHDSISDNDDCNAISEDDQTTTSVCSSDSEIDTVMHKLNNCMERSAETRKHVEMIAASLKKAGVYTPSPKTSSGGVKRKLPSTKRPSKQVKKRKDFAVTGCLVRPALDRELSMASKLAPQPALLITKIPQKNAVSSISDFLRMNKR
ncbi:MAG: hypothetical protein SGILL_004227 [Bacillariaceae sp.]